MKADTTLDVATFINARRIGPGQWTVIGLCAVVALMDGMDLQSIGLAAPAIGQELKIAPQSLGAIFSAALAGLALGAFVLGPTADRVGRKTVLIGATFLFGTFTVATAYATSFHVLLAYRFLAGLGLGGAMPSFISLASEYVPTRHRTAIVSLLWAAFPLGGVVGGLIAARMIPAYGWPSIFLIGGAIPVVLGVLLIVLLPESAAFLISRERPTHAIVRSLRRVFPAAEIPAAGTFTYPMPEIETRASVGALFQDRRVRITILLWIAYFFAFMILVTNSSWTPSLLRGVGIPVERSAIAMSLFNFGSLIGSAVAGALVAFSGPVLVLSLTMFGAALSYAFVGWAAASIPSVMIGEAIFGLLIGCASSGLIAVAAVSYPSAVRSTGVGWATTIGRFGSFVGPLAVGALLTAKLPVSAVFAGVGGSILIGACACALMPRSIAAE